MLFFFLYIVFAEAITGTKAEIKHFFFCKRLAKIKEQHDVQRDVSDWDESSKKEELIHK